MQRQKNMYNFRATLPDHLHVYLRQLIQVLGCLVVCSLEATDSHENLHVTNGTVEDVCKYPIIIVKTVTVRTEVYWS